MAKAIEKRAFGTRDHVCWKGKARDEGNCGGGIDETINLAVELGCSR